MRRSASTITAALLVALAMSGICMAQTDGEHEHGVSFQTHSLIKPLGIATFCCMICTFMAGVFRRKLARKFLKIHLPLAVISVILGLIHGILIVVLYGL